MIHQHNDVIFAHIIGDHRRRARGILQDGETPLVIATTRDDYETAEMLVKAGADLNIANKVSFNHCCT